MIFALWAPASSAAIRKTENDDQAAAYYSFGSVLGNDAGGVQRGGSGATTADDRPTERARMGNRGLCERV